MAKALAKIDQVAGLAMITLRADLDQAGDAIAQAAGLALPGQGRFTHDGARFLGWMAPDELLLILPEADLAATLADLSDAVTGIHALVADMSDARVIFDIQGPLARDVLAKLCPIDFDALPGDGLRRSRAAQTGCAIWPHGDGYRLIGFRSVADYLFDLLQNAAIPGSGLAPKEG